MKTNGRTKSPRLLPLFLAVSLLFALALPAQGAEEPSVSAKAAVVMEAGTGKVLYAKNQHEQLPIASTTKILTALIALEQPDPQAVFVVDSAAIHVEGTSMGLREGSQATLELLAQGMLLCSGNDAAGAAAVKIGGDLEGFAVLMNRRAQEIGMEHSHFVTPSGLDAEGHCSTAYDMALLAREALQNPDFAAICGSSRLRVVYPGETFSRTLANHNRLLTSYEGCIGVKTGFTKKAGRCLVSAAQRDGATLICVTLNDPDDWRDHAALLDYGFSRMDSRPVEDSLFGIYAPVVGGESDTLPVRLASPLSYSSAFPSLELERQVLLPRFLYAPVEEGEIVGSVEYYYNGSLLCKGDLLAAQSIPALPPREKKWWEKLLEPLQK